MNTPTANDQMTPCSDGDRRGEDERLFALGERIASQEGDDVDSEQLKTLVSCLVSLYDSMASRALRKRAADVAGALAKRYDIALDLVVASAGQYARTQHIDDAFPYAPNGFDVLAAAGQGNKKVISFLSDTVRSDWGIPRWKAIEALCRIDDPEADGVIVEVIRGNYPSRNPDVRADLRQIEEVRGRGFLQQHQVTTTTTVADSSKPVFEVCVGHIRGTIWAQEIDGQPPFQVKLDRTDKPGAGAGSLCCVDSDDLLMTWQVLDLVKAKVDQLKQTVTEIE